MSLFISGRPRAAVNRHPWLSMVLAAALLMAGGSSASAQGTPLERSELALGRSVGNYRLTDQNGDYFPLHKLKGSPILVSFMYIDCNGPCQLINQSIKRLRSSIDPKLVDGMTVLSVTLDTQNDSPQKLKEYGAQFSGGSANWVFATADKATVDLMVKDLGFDYNKAVNGFDHMNRLTLVGSDGVVLKHFYGINYDPKEVEAAVRGAMAGGSVISRKLSGAIGSILLTCSAYDPVTKTYKLSGMMLAQWIVQYILVIATLVWFFREKISRIFSYPASLFAKAGAGNQRRVKEAR